MSNNICLYCGKEFEAKRVDKKYCSYSCQNKSRYKDIECLNCGKVFRQTGANVKCCSIICSKEYEWNNKLPDLNESILKTLTSSKEDRCRYVEEKCCVCGKVRKIRIGDYNRAIKKHGVIFCSIQCSSIYLGKTVILKCDTCGKVFNRGKATTIRNGKPLNYCFCSKECQAQNVDYKVRGHEHYCYKDGSTSQTRGKGWKRIRRLVLIRDNDTCAYCGITGKEYGKHLDVHHVIPYRNFDNSEEANNMNNLIVLCPSCHHTEDNKILKQEQNQ